MSLPLNHWLIVEDDTKLTALMETYLSRQGFCMTVCHCIQDARNILNIMRVQGMILDVMLPDGSGLDFLSSLGPQAPATLILSALNEGTDRIAGLKIGAYDYLGKPFEAEELLWRMKKMVPTLHPYVLGNGVTYDPHRRLCWRGHESCRLDLTDKEQRLLHALWENRGHVTPRTFLAEKLGIHARSLDTAIRRLRQKIEPEHTKSPHYLHTIWGEGYKLQQ